MKPSRFDSLRRRHGKRVVVAVAIVASLGFLSHSVTRLLRSQREAHVVNGMIQRLNREVELMGRELNSTNAPQTFEALRHEEQKLVVNRSELGNWVDQLRQQGVPLVLDVEVQTGAPVAGPLAERGLRIIPVTLELAPPKGITAVKPTYQRLLQFLNSISLQTPRVDLVELRVTADSGAIDRVTAILNLWVAEATAATTIAAATSGEAKP